MEDESLDEDAVETNGTDGPGPGIMSAQQIAEAKRRRQQARSSGATPAYIPLNSSATTSSNQDGSSEALGDKLKKRYGGPFVLAWLTIARSNVLVAFKLSQANQVQHPVW